MRTAEVYLQCREGIVQRNIDQRDRLFAYIIDFASLAAFYVAQF